MRKDYLSTVFKTLGLVPVFCLTCAASFAGTANASCAEGPNSVKSVNRPEPVKPEMSGPLSPKDAFEYMKTAKGLVIVDVAAKRWYEREHFKGAVNIPIEDLSAEEEKKLYLRLPKGRPVLMHCRLGMIVPGAYRTLKRLRPDITEIYYIDGKPLFEAYNEWVAAYDK